MAKDIPTTFKVGDMRRPSLRTTSKPGGQPTATAVDDEPSLGFPAVEALLETGSVESVAEELRGSYDQLEAMSLSKDMRKKGAAKKAMGAYERAADLFEYLFQTKSTMQNPPK